MLTPVHKSALIKHGHCGITANTVTKMNNEPIERNLKPIFFYPCFRRRRRYTEHIRNLLRWQMCTTNFVCFFGRLCMTCTILPGGHISWRSLADTDNQSFDPVEHSVSDAVFISILSNWWFLHSVKGPMTLHYKTKYKAHGTEDWLLKLSTSLNTVIWTTQLLTRGIIMNDSQCSHSS